MKLLFDNNLSTKLPEILQAAFPGSKHVVDVHIDHLPDIDIWRFAIANNFSIVTKDKDFYNLSTTFGSPPKVIWLTVGNCRNKDIIKLLADKQNEINLFLKSNKDLLLLN